MLCGVSHIIPFWQSHHRCSYIVIDVAFFNARCFVIHSAYINWSNIPLYPDVQSTQHTAILLLLWVVLWVFLVLLLLVVVVVVMCWYVGFYTEMNVLDEVINMLNTYCSNPYQTICPPHLGCLKMIALLAHPPIPNIYIYNDGERKRCMSCIIINIMINEWLLLINNCNE